MNISDEDIDQISEQFMDIMGDNPDGLDFGTAPPFPFLNNIFGQQNSDASVGEGSDEEEGSDKKDKKENKGQKKRKVNLCKRFSVENKNCRNGNGEGYSVGDNSENCEEGYRKKNGIYSAESDVDFIGLFVGYNGNFLFSDEKCRNDKQNERKNRIGEHSHEKVGDCHVECREKIKILRIADGCEHTSEVCGNGFKSYQRNEELFTARKF